MRRIALALILSIVGCQPVLASVPAGTAPLIYTCSGSSTYTFTFPVFTSTEVVVTLRTTADGSETVLTAGVDYTVSAPNSDYFAGPGGTVTTTTAYGTGYEICISRAVAQTQTQTLRGQRYVDMGALQDALDKLTMLVQDLAVTLGRCLAVPTTDPNSGDDLKLPSSVDRAGHYLGFDAEGAPVATDGTSSNPLISAFAATVTDDSNGPEMLATMGVTAWQRDRLAQDSNAAEFASDMNDCTWNVKRYGAKGDGVTDDSAAIQIAYNKALAAGGGIVFLPTGQYHLHSPIVLNTATGGADTQRPIIIQGAGAGRPQSNGTRLDVSGLSAGQAAFIHSGTNYTYNHSFRDFSVAGNGATQTVGVANGINLNYTSNFTFNDLEFRYCKEGIDVNGLNFGIHAVDCVFNYNGRGVVLQNNATANVVTLDNCTFLGNTEPNAAFEAETSTATTNLHQFRINGGWFEANGYAGIRIGDSKSVSAFSLSNSYFELDCLTGGSYDVVMEPTLTTFDMSSCVFSSPNTVASVLLAVPYGANVRNCTLGTANTVRSMDIGKASASTVYHLTLQDNKLYDDPCNVVIKYLGTGDPHNLVLINNQASEPITVKASFEITSEDANGVSVKVGGCPVSVDTNSVTASLDPNNLTAYDGNDILTVAFPDVALGDEIHPEAPYDLQGVVASAYVSTAGVCKVVLWKPTAGDVNLAPGTWTLRQRKH